MAYMYARDERGRCDFEGNVKQSHGYLDISAPRYHPRVPVRLMPQSRRLIIIIIRQSSLDLTYICSLTLGFGFIKGSKALEEVASDMRLATGGAPHIPSLTASFIHDKVRDVAIIWAESAKHSPFKSNMTEHPKLPVL
jgi:hypothetical protein